MKNLILAFVLLSSSIIAQDNPMFDSLDYFQRNKIKTIHCKANSWWYAPPFKEWKISFDKESKTKSYNSFVYWDSSPSELTKAVSSNLSNGEGFTFEDQMGSGNNGQSFVEIKHFFDRHKRLQKKLVVEQNSPTVSTYGFRYTDSTSKKSETNKKHITTTTYYYADTISSKLKKIVVESPYYIEETNFYYEKYLLSLKIKVDSNKLDNRIKCETITYDYYPDRKLKRETHRVAIDHCPGIAGRTSCQGTIEYKYDTEFKNDSTPIPGIPYVPLLTIKNNKKIELYAYLWAYPDKGNKDRNSFRFSSDIKQDSTYEIVFDSRPDNKYIVQIKKQWSPILHKEEYTGLEVIVYANPNPDKTKPFDPTKAEVIFTEKVTLESLFEKPKTIKIK